jgi:RNA polymerase sigma factor (sigma-70 family)
LRFSRHILVYATIIVCDHMRVEKERMQQHDECTQEKNAAAAIYDRFASSIFAYARLNTPSWEDAEDVTLEVFTAALEWENFSALTEQQQLSWLRRVAHNKLVDRYRSAVHLSAVPLEQVRETVRTEEALAPEQMVLRGEELERLYQAVRGLPLFQQQLLQLRFGEGLRFAEIAVLLNKREATLRKLCSRTIALLRTIYEQQ